MRNYALHNNVGFRCAFAAQMVILVSIIVSFSTRSTPFIEHFPVWIEGDSKHVGVNREYRDKASLLRWQRDMGDWCDADGELHGERAFDTVQVGKKAKFIRLDISDLIAQQKDVAYPYWDVVLRIDEGILRIPSKEAKNDNVRPRVVLNTDNGVQIYGAIADTHTDNGTHAALGRARTLKLDGQSLAMFRFTRQPDIPFESAFVELAVKKVSAQGVRASLYRSCLPPQIEAQRAGIAQGFTKDKDIETHPHVLFVDNFEHQARSESLWTTGQSQSDVHIIAEDPDNQFEPLAGQALKVRIGKGKHRGSNLQYLFAKEGKDEPASVYLRYYLRFGDDWQTSDGGKLPGLAGTYGRAGWGGRRANGTNGWSARGLYRNALPLGHIAERTVPIGTYLYHADMNDHYGENLVWDRQALGLLQKNTWYSIETHVKLNTPGGHDGHVHGWIDGYLAFKHEHIRFRDNEELNIEAVWMNVYHGGGKPSPRDIHLYIDNVVVATSYIGPMNQQ